MVTITINETGTRKGNLVEMAFEECGSAGFTFEKTPEENASALRELEAMMREWPWNLLGYAHDSYGVGLMTDLSGIPDTAISAVAKHLALRLAPKMGAVMSAESKAALARSFNLLLAENATVPTAHMPGGTHRGSGSRLGTVTPVIEA